MESQQMPILVGPYFKVGPKLGEGSFGELRLGVNLKSQEMVAIKFEPLNSGETHLQSEYETYKKIGEAEGFPRIYYYGLCGKYNCLVLQLLGKSLEDLFDLCNRKFSLKTVVQIAIQIIDRFENLHDRNYVYCDIKPQNFLLGCNSKANIIHLIDFGMAKEYRDPDTGRHCIYSQSGKVLGTVRYLSLNTNFGHEHSRRDDLEAFGYMLIYFFKGELPWQGLHIKDQREKIRRIGKMKQTMPIEDICKGCPKEFEEFLSYCRKLSFFEIPDYDFLRKLFKNLFEKGFANDNIYDWTLKIQAEELKKDNKPDDRSIF
ncbi:casein kinase I isoform gamma-3-like protein [Dinothrombium tinctorium]|uniref:non-specific serine/threonine protein kinase n=1 Tax=Dinothrombium tinctorium TaxID=1965070 RepID=A0A443RJ34_9ACAR|nr:casein kinase I isoform gamma-3-like protein [Dinothrombium tinctorium]